MPTLPGAPSIKNLFTSGGLTLGFLAALSIYSLAVIKERWSFYRQALSGIDELLVALRRHLKDGALDKIVPLCRAHRGLAQDVVMASLIGSSGREERKRQAERALRRALLKLSGRMTALNTIAATAPFIGLFGTVIGVIRAFRDLAFAAGAGPGVVAAGISEALVNTAAGLFVAIPAVWASNYFARKMSEFSEEMDWISDEILDHLTERGSA